MEEKQKKIWNINIEEIVPNKNQPRKEFNQKELEELSNSIKNHGIIQPILIQKIKNGYEIIAGERRLRAGKLAGLKEIPSIIKKVDPEESSKIALIENIQRTNLNPIEEAQAYRKLIKNFNLSQEELGRQIGKSRSYIANTIRLLNLDEEVIEEISKGRLSQGHGKALLALGDREEQKNALKKILEEDLNVRETENLARAEKDLEKELNQSYIKTIENDLMMSLGTKVNLIYGESKGKIEIEYYSDEDLERLLETLIG